MRVQPKQLQSVVAAAQVSLALRKRPMAICICMAFDLTHVSSLCAHTYVHHLLHSKHVTTRVLGLDKAWAGVQAW